MRLVAIALVTLLGGRGCVELGWGHRSDSPADAWTRGFLGALVGLGLMSSLFSATLLLGAGASRALWAALVPLGAASVLGSGWLRSAAHAEPARLPLPWMEIGLFAALALICAATGFEHTRLQPDGDYDAWMIWNQRARFLFRGDPLRAFPAEHPGTHPDYPLFLPGLVALGWQMLGETQAWPIALSWLGGALAVGLLASSVASASGGRRGLGAGLVLLSTPRLVLEMASQEADIWVALFLLGANVVLFQVSTRGNGGSRRPLLLAGLLLGLGAWTKNEGNLYLVSVLLAIGTQPLGDDLRARLRKGVLIAAGALPLLILIAGFKAFHAPPNDLFDGGVRAMGPRLLNPIRWGETVLVLVRRLLHFQVWTLGWAAAIAALAYLARAKRLSTWAGPRALAFAWIGLVIVYVTTPHDLYWQITHSADRLLLQCWPSVIFMVSTSWPAAPFQALNPGSNLHARETGLLREAGPP